MTAPRTPPRTTRPLYSRQSHVVACQWLKWTDVVDCFLASPSCISAVLLLEIHALTSLPHTSHPPSPPILCSFFLTECGVNLNNQSCPAGQCCSADGYCGSDFATCGTGCQSGACYGEWGWEPARPLAHSSTLGTPRSPTPRPLRGMTSWRAGPASNKPSCMILACNLGAHSLHQWHPSVRGPHSCTLPQDTLCLLVLTP